LSCRHPQQEAPTSTDENKALVQRWFNDVVSQGDMSSFDAICAVCHPDFEMIRGVANPAPRGFEATKGLISSLRTAFPDLSATVDEQIAEGDKVVSLVTMTGTHQGDFMGIPATGRSFTMPGVSVWEVRDGQLISEMVSWDSMAMMQQLGVAPAPPGQS
ncbi:MAG TPA: ester cyclase, partial [Acidimicrobiia bacterium]|nr:ester cyclase [Acidimicrobiia bacterium]